MLKILSNSLIQYIKVLIALLIICSTANAGPIANNSQIPFFASIKSSHVNARTGPNVRYPIQWIYIKRSEPVEIVAKFDQWYKIKDSEADESWIHFNMVSKKRFVVIKTRSPLYTSSDSEKNVVVFLEPNVRAELKECNSKKCSIKLNNLRGWVDRKSVWGLHKEEFQHQ